MKLGQAALDKLRQEVTGQLKPGEELVLVGALALDKTMELLEQNQGLLAQRFAATFLWKAGLLRSRYAIQGKIRESEIWKLAEKYGASGRIEIGEDGFMACLWKLAEASGVGMHVDLRKIPIRQETIEICEEFDVNPYEAPCGGVFLAGFENAYAFVEECEKLGLPTAVIGLTNRENARLLFSGDSFRYLDRPRK